jgi:hypothetical protein
MMMTKLMVTHHSIIHRQPKPEPGDDRFVFQNTNHILYFKLCNFDGGHADGHQTSSYEHVRF